MATYSPTRTYELKVVTQDSIQSASSGTIEQLFSLTMTDECAYFQIYSSESPISDFDFVMGSTALTTKSLNMVASGCTLTYQLEWKLASSGTYVLSTDASTPSVITGFNAATGVASYFADETSPLYSTYWPE